MSATSTLLSANLRTHGRRYVSTGLAVAISTAFIAITLIVMTTLAASLSAGVYSRYRGGTIVVERGKGGTEESMSRATEALKALPGVSGIKEMGQWPGEAQSDYSRGKLYVSILPSDPFEKPRLTRGKLPESETEIVIPESTASTLKLSVGDTLGMRPGYSSKEYRSVSIVGLTPSRTSGIGLPSSYLTDKGFAAVYGTSTTGAILVATSSPDADQNANPPVATQETWVASANSALAGIPDITVSTVKDKIKEDLDQAQIGSAATMAIMLVFPAIAALVASIVVSSTFRVVLAQRTRELALLRTLGATRGQVRSLVVREAFAIGAISSAIGVAAGALIGTLAAWGTGLADSFPAAIGALSPVQLIGTWLGATLFTTLVGVFPARAASRVAPIAALAPVNEVGAAARKKHTVRFIIGLLMTVGSCALVALALSAKDNSAKFLGAFGGSILALIGAILVISVLLPSITRGFGLLFPGMLSAMARENTTRNPGRTSATGTAIIIGVTLVVTIMVGAASMRTTLVDAVNSARPFDLIAVSRTGVLTDEQKSGIVSTEGVAATVDQYGAPGELTKTSGAPAYKPLGNSDLDAEVAASVSVSGEPDYTSVVHSPVTQLGDDQVRVGEKSVEGQKLKLCVDSCVELTAVYSNSLSFGQAAVSEATLRRISEPERQAVIIKMVDGADPETVQSALLKDASLDVSGSALERKIYMTMIDRLMLVLVGLLGVSVLVSLVGVANTLSLSVAERTRENGLLRALGLTKRQMKGLMAVEALILSLTGALIGLVLGACFGWIGVLALPLEDATPVLSIPWGQLAIVFVIAVVCALVASWLPGRRAARVSPSEALATE
ncbi:FtsX-like permease family protein [Schaalia odontolytica]|uniref:FtsX-like permease family protein n=1 Tax=Schaalia odontolytica TaxID=1660 RepID=UPI00211D02CE|nr:FtsX-like permease family protein [Schaalia odontolytica]UUO93303.1 FtsX-like permease family protein [Schaalia odontolytica]